jgi:tRNA A37 threonylcarbamoyltransferase TsaD
MTRAIAYALLTGARRADPRQILRLGHGRHRHLATTAAARTSASTSTSNQPRERKPKQLLTLAIETSCDDTCVAILEKHGSAARLLFNDKVTSDNREFGGIKPTVAVESHTAQLPPLVERALQCLPEATSADKDAVAGGRRKPDFISVTRGPGIASALSVGLTMAKGLAVAWQVPLVAVHHMQAHALTPRLVKAMEQPWRLEADEEEGSLGPDQQLSPTFPFLTLLVSGGHTQLLLSRSVTSHTMLAEALNVAIGDMLDKCARAILPAEVVAAAGNVMYGARLEAFAFPPTSPSDPPNPQPNYAYTPPATRAEEIKSYHSTTGSWFLTPPLAQRRDMAYDFSGLGGQVQAIMQKNPDMPTAERRELARETMRIAFEHLASRVLFALHDMHGRELRRGPSPSPPPQTQTQTQTQTPPQTPKTLIISGGVASNRYLQHVLTHTLHTRGHDTPLDIVRPPAALCTDNAAMIAWAGMEMYEGGGWRSELDVLPVRRWSMDDGVVAAAAAADGVAAGGGSMGGGGGILGVGGWRCWWEEGEGEKNRTGMGGS